MTNNWSSVYQIKKWADLPKFFNLDLVKKAIKLYLYQRQYQKERYKKIKCALEQTKEED